MLAGPRVSAFVFFNKLTLLQLSHGGGVSAAVTPPFCFCWVLVCGGRPNTQTGQTHQNRRGDFCSVEGDYWTQARKYTQPAIWEVSFQLFYIFKLVRNTCHLVQKPLFFLFVRLWALKGSWSSVCLLWAWLKSSERQQEATDATWAVNTTDWGCQIVRWPITVLNCRKRK